MPEPTVGVPESTQALDKLNPVGNAGALAHEVIAPPLAVGVCAVIAEFIVNVNGEPA